MLAIFKPRILLTLLGFLLLALFVWYAGPYFAFADLRPLESPRSRLIAIGVIVAIWFVKGFLKQLRAGLVTDKLLKSIAQVRGKGVEAPVHGDAAQLRATFEEAVDALKKEKRGRLRLYDLPWYVIIGPPGSGKTTALVNSGLNFPLAQRFGKNAVRGVGGTRNCDWWFTNEAVFLDTAGRYTTQDSDQTADSAGWTEFLNLLRRYRKRRPVNGVIVAMSASDLLTLTPAERESNVEAVRRRLDELNRHLRISLPVYVIVTKCDLVAGFTEYFDDLGQEGRAQVWGTTFPYEKTEKGEAAAGFATEFDALMTRLSARLLTRMEEEKDGRRRTALYAFPPQMAALRDTVSDFIVATFAATRFDGKVLLRGVYFTSGTQEGTPIDRLMGAVGRAFALQPDAVVPGVSGRGKAYFIERLLKDVVLAESGLAGLNRRFELQKAALQFGAYAALALLAVLGVIALSVSFGRNRAYLADVSNVLSRFGEVPAPHDTASLAEMAPRLDALRAVVTTAEQHRGHVPLRMRAGLFQGGAVGNAARDAYVRELNGRLLPGVAQGLKERLVAHTAEPDKLYEYLKAYLMLGLPEHLDKTQLEFLVDLEWQDTFASQPDLLESMRTHFRTLLDQQSNLRALPLDETLVTQARTTVRQASLARLMYSRVRLNYVGDTERALRLDEATGLGSDRVFVRRNGTPLSEPIPSLYTKAVFEEVTGLGAAELAQQFMADSWVLGEENGSIAGSTRLVFDVIDVYEQDYIRTWDAILNDIALRPMSSVTQASEVLAILAAPTSPLRGLLEVVEANTNLTKPKDDPDKSGAVSAAVKATQKRLEILLDAGRKTAGAAEPSTPGARVTRHFEPLHKLVAGAPGSAPIDRVIAQLGQIQQQLQAVGSGVGETNPIDVIVREGQGNAVKTLQQQAKMLPAPIGSLVAQVGGRSDSLVTGAARGELYNRYQQMVVKDCVAITRGRYPFTAGSSIDVPLADFGHLFGYGGVFDTFFKEDLASMVDTARNPWRWRPGASGSSGMLRQFEAAQRIREMFFKPGGQLPEIRFNLFPSFLDAGATRFVLEVDGQTFEYRHGPERSWTATWPGPAPGIAAISFEDRAGGHPNQPFAGPWAFFKLLDAAAMQPESDVRYRASFRAGSNEARVVIEATSIRNPFGKPDLRQFRCSS
ncbi:MAG TPA: type VI secretion system membrane subunit TssM [Steroidobacteraceae bacterium]|nr:type VI secretion system membrane subunit TssM [Steroidobacteraceae bacterium]